MNRKALQTAIIISWVVLAVCFFIKIFGGNYFEIATNNQTFIKICNFIDSNFVLTIIMSFITYSLSVVLLTLAVLRQLKLKLKQFIIIIITIIIVFIAKVFIQYETNLMWLSFILDLICYFAIPAILSRKPLRALLGVVLYFVFQTISLIVKSIALTTAYEMNTLIALIYSLDIYIMLILYYLYGSYTKKDNK